MLSCLKQLPVICKDQRYLQNRHLLQNRYYLGSPSRHRYLKFLQKSWINYRRQRLVVLRLLG